MSHWKVKNEKAFRNKVFGGDSLIEHFPEILTTGVELEAFAYRGSTWFHIMKNGIWASDSSFFSVEEMKQLEQVD